MTARFRRIEDDPGGPGQTVNAHFGISLAMNYELGWRVLLTMEAETRVEAGEKIGHDFAPGDIEELCVHLRDAAAEALQLARTGHGMDA